MEMIVWRGIAEARQTGQSNVADNDRFLWGCIDLPKLAYQGLETRLIWRRFLVN
jgi:hypothetical protein